MEEFSNMDLFVAIQFFMYQKTLDTIYWTLKETCKDDDSEQTKQFFCLLLKRNYIGMHYLR